MSDLDLFSHSDEESDSRGSYESPMSYKEYVALSKSSSSLKRRRHPERPPVVLQTSCSSEDDDYAPLSKTKYDQRGSRVNYGRRPPPSRLKADQQSSGVDNGRRSHLGPKVPSTGTKDKVHTPLTDVTNTNPSKSTNSVEEGSDRKNESADTHSLAGIEKALLETNQLLRGVLKRVDKCEKQIKSFETKLNETSSTSSGPGCTPSRKKGQIPEDVRVRYS